MSRLDDELRKAFRRQEPSVDFTARLLQQVAVRPAPKASWWQRLAMLLEPPKLRWVAIGVTASLLLAIGAAQYNQMRRAAVGVGDKIAVDIPPKAGSTPAVNPETPKPTQTAVTMTSKAAPNKFIKRTIRSSTNQRPALARFQNEHELAAEAQAAKEKLILALSIASSALGDAQKAVRDEGPKP